MEEKEGEIGRARGGVVGSFNAPIEIDPGANGHDDRGQDRREIRRGYNGSYA